MSRSLIACSLLPVVAAILAGGPGCITMNEPSRKEVAAARPDTTMTLMPGDDLEISVFGAPELCLIQKVRPDGNISVKLFGDIYAAGKTPAQLQAELAKLYESQLQLKAITVVARTSAVVYVGGAVIRPGKVELTRPMTALDAIMEAGGFDQRAGAQRNKVKIIRTEGDQMRNYFLDLDEILDRNRGTPFYLKPFDTIYIPGAW
jgi:protein involved in polysaccharide export with SLBB domain